jgi:malonyl CoA-acyl carrier protein transacylase
MLAVTGLLQPALDAKITETNSFLSAHGKGTVHISLFNGLKAFVVTGPPASLVGLVNNLKKGKAESGKDQSKIPHSKRLPVFSMRFLPIGVPYHSPHLHECTKAAMENDVDEIVSASFWDRSKLQIPVYNTESGRDLRSSSEQHGQGELVKELFDQIFTSPIHWSEATKFNNDATHVVDFGTGGQSGIGSLTARETEGKGLRVVVASTGTNGRNVEEVYSSTKLKAENKWMDKFGPRLVKTRHDGKIHLDTAMSRLLSKPPLMVAGMTPCTVGAGFNAAVANAGELPSSAKYMKRIIY